MISSISKELFSTNLKQQLGPVGQRIHAKLMQSLNPVHIEIYDDSDKHAGHAAMRGGNTQETHFRLVIVSDQFQDKMLIDRHRLVNTLLEDELKASVHAL